MAKKYKKRYEDTTMDQLEERRQQKLSSSVEEKPFSLEEYGKNLLGKEFGMDTFERDLQSVTSTVNSISSEWQTQETMQNTKSSVEDMMKRINAYQTYQKRYGGEDLTELYGGYEQLLRKWDDLSGVYAGFENADAFNKARTKSILDKQFKGLTYEDVQAQMKQYDKDSDEYKYLSQYTGYTDLRDFDKALEAYKKPSATREELQSKYPNVSQEDILERMKQPRVANGGAITYKSADGQDDYLKRLETARNQYALDNAFDSYKQYLDAEDFEWKSRYESTKNDSFGSRLTSQYGMGYEDVTYEYINNVDGIRDEIKSKARAFGADSGDGVSSMEKKGYDKLNDDEIAVYNYIYRMEGKDKAQKFLDDMEVTLTKRVYDEATQRWENATDSGVGASTLMSALSVPTRMYGAISGTVDAVSDLVEGKQYNPYGYYKMPTNFSNDTREYVGENIAEATEGFEIFGQNIPSFLYQTGMSVADTVVGGKMFGSSYTALMGLSSAQNTAKELKEAGATSEQLAFGSVASGITEMLFEKASLDHWLKIKGADSWKKVIKETAKQMTIEGSEEFFTEIANLMVDEFNRGKQSDTYKMYEDYLARGFSEEEAEKKVKQELNKQIGFALAGGALSGFALGGTSSLTSHHDLSNTGKQIRENDRVSEMLEFKEFTPKEAEAYKLYNEYAKKGITADTISNAQLGNLYQTSKAEAKDIIESKKTTTEQKVDALNRLGKLGVVNTSKSDEERAIKQRAESLNRGEVTEVASTGNATKIEGIKIEDGKTIVRTGEGEFDVDQMTFSKNDASIIAHAESMGEEKGNLMLSQYDGKVNADDFVKSFELAYSYGEIGMGVDSVLKNKGVLTEVQASEIYKTAMTNKSNERQRVIDEINEKHSKTVFVEGKFDDSIIDYDGTVTDGSKVAWKDLTKTQRNAITFAKGFSKATGVNITFIQSEVKDGKRVGKNGSYNPATNTIEIDVYAGIIDAKTVKDSIIPTLSHEMTHWMKAKSPAMYSKIREHALETLAMTGNLSSDERVAIEMDRIKQAHPNVEVTEEMAIDEIVARYSEDMLANSNTARKLLNQMSKKEQQTFIAKVKDTFNNLMEWVNELLAQYKSSSKEAEILREYKNRLKEVSKMWDKALEEAIKANQSLQAEGITGEQLIGENVITENTAQFSIRTYENEGRDLLHKWLENSDLSKKDKKNIIEQMDYVYDVATKYAQENDLVDFASWSDTDIIRRDDGTPILTVVVPNGEYPLNIDFSQICKKRKALNAVLNALVRSGDLDLRTLSQSDIGNINRIIKEHGFEIACALCFVDSKRYRVNEWADSFADTFNKLVKSLAKGTGYKVDEYNYTGRNVKQPEGKLLKDADDSELNFDYINEVLAKNSSGKAIYRYALAIKNNKELRSTLNSSEIISSAGLDAIKVQNELLYSLVNSHQGSAKPKLSHSENPYGYEILLDARFNAEDAYKVGGVRIQSFSDYMANMFFDYVQMIGDLSAKRLPAHAYTKEYYFAKLFGLTGIKINMSIVPKGADITEEQKARFNKMTKAMKEKDAEFKALKSHAGLDANGNYILEDETFPLDKALEIQNTEGYDANCGIIWVGVSDAHINKMLDDENVPFIIPYHKSSLNPAIARMRNIDFYNDYTKAQNTRYDSKAKKKVPASVWSFDFYADLAKTNDPRQTAENYKTECQNRGYLPKFDEFAKHPNYYKLLVDFRVYDANGNYAPQSAVKMEFPSDFNEIVSESLVEAQDTQNKLDADMKVLLDEIRSELKLGTQNQQEQYSDRVFDDAEEVFGTTTNFEEAGYILPNGKMLKFTDDRKRGERLYDHRAIAKVYGANVDVNVNRGFSLENGKYLDDFVEKGGIRLDSGNPDLASDVGLQLSSSIPLTKNQEQAIRDLVKWKKEREELYVSTTAEEDRWLYRPLAIRISFGGDSSNAGGSDSIRRLDAMGAKYLNYEGGNINADRIISDIRRYYQTGELREQSELMMFHTQYADRDSYGGVYIDWLIDSLDDYIANLSDEDFLDVVDEEPKTNIDTPKVERTKRRIDEVNKRLKEIGLSFNGTKSFAWTDERIDKYLSGGYYGSSNPKYAQAYITYMTPQQFLNLTVGSKMHTLDRIQNESESYGEVDVEKLGNSTPIFLEIEEGKTKAEVAGHEGRHRMYMLGKAGVERVPVLLFDYRTKYDKTAKSELKLTAQRFNEDDFISKSRDVVVNDVIPFSQGNRDLIVEKFGSGNKTADIRFADRDNVSVYDAMGETESLKKQNAILKADIERLKERLKLERQVTNGNAFNEKQLTAVAKHIRSLAKSDYAEVALVDELREVYSYITETPQLDWEVLMAKSYDVARRVIDSSKGYKVTNDYFKSILDNIRKERIMLNAEQMQEAKNAFGEKYRDAFMGKVILVKEGTSLDQKWQEWSAMYPEIFNADIAVSDQITELYDIYNSLREGAEMYQIFNDEESIRSLATEIYNQYWNVSTIRTTADKYESKIKRINYEHRKTMSELREGYKKRVKDQKVADDIHYGKIISNLRRKRDEYVKEARKLGKKRLDEHKDRAERNAKIQSITKKSLTLNQWLTKNSRDEHIPEVMKAPVAYLLNAIDFSSKQLLGMRNGSNAGMPTKRDISLSKALEQVHDMVAKINSAQIGEGEITEIYGTFADFPAGFADDIRALSSTVNDVMRTVGDNAYVLNQMNLEQLETLDKIVTIIKATVTKMNKFLAIRHAEGVANLSQQSIVEMDELGKAKTHEGWRGKIDKLVDWGNALPYYTFKRFGKGGQMVYEALQDGWDKFAFHVKSIIDYAESVYTSDEVKEWSKDIKTFDVLEPATDEEKANKGYKPKYQKVQMSVPQIMSLYALQKREQAKGHLMGGGMRVSDIKVKNNVISQTEGVILSQSEIDTIINSLTGRQKAVADALQKFMNTVCTDWGNEVSMLRFGFKGFGEDNYFPIQSDKNNLAVNDETEQNNSLFRLLNMSFTKGTIQNANNRIVISDIFDVFAQHTSDMAKYNALALPILDSFKWYNYKEKAQKGETQFITKSLKQSMENAFGKDAQNYFTTFLRDINGEHSAGRDSVGGGFFTNAKIASVGFNMRVVALQPTSYVRASAVIDPKYLTKALVHKPKSDMAQKHSGIALWKSLGFYDINVQNGVADMIKHNETRKDRFVEKSMKGAEMADKLTWGYLWNACELEIRDKRNDLKVGSKEFYDEIAKRLREVIYATQVVDSTMTRSHMMRSKDGRDKMLTAFASEPTLAYNMLQDAYYDWKLTERRTGSVKEAIAQNKKKMARVFVSYTATNLACALIEAGFDAFRDDEEELTAEEFMKLYWKNFASDMSILNKIPYAKELTSMLQGYSSSRTDTQWMQYMVNTLKGVGKLMEGEGNAYTTFKNAVRAFSQASGLPFYNMYRDTMALVNELDILTAEEVEEVFNETVGEMIPSQKSK